MTRDFTAIADILATTDTPPKRTLYTQCARCCVDHAAGTGNTATA